MSKKWIKNLVAGAVCVAVLGTTFGMDYMMVSADTTDDEANVVETEVSFDVTDGNSSFPIKEETVFISTDASGETNHIQVSEWLKNEDKSEVLKDATNLLDIENVNGEELFMQNGRDLDIQANGSDIYYRGKLDASTELPISLEVSYKLDGTEILPADLEGKSGHLEMTIQYRNNTSTTIEEDGELYDVCVPFTVTSVMMLPSENVRNISIKNGKVIETGSLAMVLGFGFPGINESFGVEDGVFTDTVVLEADVEDYSVETIMTYCSNDVLREADLEDAVSMESVTNSLEEITNTSVDGLQEINSFDDLVDELDAKKEDLNRMNDGAGELKDGAKELSNGAVSLKNNMILFDTNMSDAALGAVELAEGAAIAATSAEQLAQGASQVCVGANALNSGIQGMYSGIETQISQLTAALGSGALDAATTTQYTITVGVLTNLKNQMDAAGLTAGAATLANGAGEVYNGAGALSAGLATLSSGTNDLSAGLQELSSASGQLADGTVDLASGSVKLVDGTSEMKDGTQELANLFEGDTGVFVNTGKALQEAAENYSTFTSLREGQEGSVSFVIKSE
jgi:putative membrane protein